MKKRILISLILPVLLLPLIVFSACGGSEYTKISNYIKDNGDLNLSIGVYDIAYVDYTAGYRLSAWYKIQTGETLYAIRITHNDTEESLMITTNDVGDSFEIGYAITEENGDTICEVRGFIIAENLGLKDLEIVTGSCNSLHEERINELVLLLLLGVDRYIFGDSGIKMSNLGFKY